MIQRLLFRHDASGQACYMFEFEEPLVMNQFAPLASLDLTWWDEDRNCFSTFPFEGLSDDELWGVHSSSGLRIEVPSDDLKAYLLGQRELHVQVLHHVWIVGDERALYWVSREADTTALDTMSARCGQLPPIEISDYLPLLK